MGQASLIIFANSFDLRIIHKGNLEVNATLPLEVKLRTFEYRL